MNNPKQTENLSNKFLLTYIFLASFSFLLTLHYGYLGEEGVYVSTSLEIWYHSHYTQPLLYGTSYPRPPLLNWFIIPLASGLGWENALLASRIVAVLATLTTTALLYWFVVQLFSSKYFALLCSALFLTGDILFKRGWLAYSDPMFSLFVFASIAFLWVAVHKKQHLLMVLAVIALLCAFLTKAVTAFVFYSVALVVLAYAHKHRQFLLRPTTLVLHGLALIFYFYWSYSYLNDAGSTMLWDITRRFVIEDFSAYLVAKFNFQIQVLLRNIPLLLVALYLLLSKRFVMPQDKNASTIKALSWIVLLNYLPYALTPADVYLRYIMPLYPLLAILLAYIFYQSTDGLKWLKNLLVLTLIIKFLAALGGYTWMDKFTHDYDAKRFPIIAEDILTQIDGQNLYIHGYMPSVVASLQQLNLPNEPIKNHSLASIQDKQSGYYLLSDSVQPDLVDAQLITRYTNGRLNYHLYCLGLNCKST